MNRSVCSVFGFIYLLLRGAREITHICELYTTFGTLTSVRPWNCAVFTAVRVNTVIGLDSLLQEVSQGNSLSTVTVSGWAQLYEPVAKQEI